MSPETLREQIDLNRYRVAPDGDFALTSIEPDDSQGLEDKDAAKAALKANREQMAELQERLYAEGKQSLLLVLQAMDTGGKDSTIRHVTEGLNPQGCSVASFKAPTDLELAHDFLWRIHQQAPPKGHIRIFNRSHYEDVLIVKVHGWALPEVIEQRYAHINAFERLLSDAGTRIVKVMLYISKDYQLERLRRRLRRPDKHWKFNPGDLDEREHWPTYMAAYEAALRRCSTEHAPWYVVPAERRWFRDLVVSTLLLNALETMNPQYPKPTFNPADYPPESIR
ncbi:MAG: polyphosphate kinase 2 family protein [Rhodothermales bacterium]